MRTATVIRFEAPQVLYAYKVAEVKARKYKDFEGASYPNRPQGHFVGRLGEMAAYQWFKQNGLGPKANFHFERNSEPDIELYRTKQRVEVKSWRVSQFNKLGFAVNLKQLPAIMERCDVLVWTAVGVDRYEPYDEVLVNIMGWNLIDDLEDARPVNLGGYENIQLPRDKVRPMDTFFHKVRGRVAVA